MWKFLSKSWVTASCTKYCSTEISFGRAERIQRRQLTRESLLRIPNEEARDSYDAFLPDWPTTPFTIDYRTLYITTDINVVNYLEIWQSILQSWRSLKFPLSNRVEETFLIHIKVVFCVWRMSNGKFSYLNVCNGKIQTTILVFVFKTSCV